MDNHEQQSMAEHPEDLKLEWPESEERIDIIGQNGNTGEHYASQTGDQ